MVKREFRWNSGSDREDGHSGWQLKGHPELDPVQSFGVAHDVLEHFTNYGTLEHEGLAFGAVMWDRGRSGYWNQRCIITSPEYIASRLAGDIAESLCKDPRRITPHRKEIRLEEVFEIFLSVLARRVIHEMRDFIDVYRGYEVAHTRRDVLNFINWMRHGFNGADSRWGEVP